MGSKQMEASFSYNYVNVRKYTIYNPFFLKPLCGCLSPALLIVKMQMVIFYHAIKSAKKSQMMMVFKRSRNVLP